MLTVDLASSSETAKVKYVQWMVNQSNRTDLSPVIQDMARFFAVYTHEKQKDGPCIPGSSTVRKFKA